MLSNNLAVNLAIPNERAMTLLEYGFDKIKRGLITEEEFWSILEKAHGIPIPANKRNIWMEWEDIIPIDEVMQLRAGLQSHGLVTGILSNVEPVVAKALYDHGVYSNFEPLILSCETGYAKPDLEIYQIALNKLGSVKTSEVLFIDDQEKMLLPAREMGMQTLLARNTDQLISDVLARTEFTK